MISIDILNDLYLSLDSGGYPDRHSEWYAELCAAWPEIYAQLTDCREQLAAARKLNDALGVVESLLDAMRDDGELSKQGEALLDNLIKPALEQWRALASMPPEQEG